MIRPKVVPTPDQALKQVQDAVSEAIVALQRSNPILNGVFVDVTVGMTDTEVVHGLTRAFMGFLVVNRDAGASIWESSTVNSRPQDKLILQASAEVNATLYVF